MKNKPSNRAIEDAIGWIEKGIDEIEDVILNQPEMPDVKDGSYREYINDLKSVIEWMKN